MTDGQQQPTSISVMLIVSDAEAAVAWYSNPSEDSPDRLGVTSTRIELFVDDPDGVMTRAIAAGASPGSELEDHQVPGGTHRQGGFRDPFGHNWSVGDRSPLSRQAN